MTSWRDASFAVVDLETTGLDPIHDEVLSVGIVHIDCARISVASAFYSLVRPQRMPPAETIVVHGIRPADLQGAPLPQHVAPLVLDALGGRDVVAHVADIEESFLARWLPGISASFVDTDCLMRLYLAQERGTHVAGHVGLGAAAQWFGLPEHRRHHALGDALTTAQLFLALASRIDGGGSSVEQLRSAERALRKARRPWRRR